MPIPWPPAAETRLLKPTTPSILGEDTTRVDLSPITCLQISSITSVHVFPGNIDIPRLEAAIREVGRLYPVVAGRLGSSKKKSGDGLNYFIDLTASSIPLELVTSLATGPPLPTPAVIQPNLELYVNTVDPTHMNASADNVDAAMLTLKLTHLPEAEGGERTVLGVSFAHIMGDGASFCVFMRTLGRLYEGETIAEHEWWNWGPHVDLIEEPSEEMLAKWEHPLLWPTYDLRTAFGMYCAGADGDLVQWTLTPDEISLLKTLATGAGHSGWVSEQDAISSYWLNILNLCGENITSTMNTINFRSFFPTDPHFPSTLPRLCANVAQLWDQPLPAHDPSNLSLIPYACAIREGLRTIRANPDTAREWISCRGYRMGQTADRGESQGMAVREGHSMINSNWRYDWNVPFGFPASQTQHHTAFASKNFLRVFRANPSAHQIGAECTFRVRKGTKDNFDRELAVDRGAGFARWGAGAL